VVIIIDLIGEAMSAEAAAAAGGGFLTAEFMMTHGAVFLGVAFLAATTGVDLHHLAMEGIVEPVLGA
jgi:hypothetical protein